jgi:outer membrane translocation and assembly module TamA
MSRGRTQHSAGTKEQEAFEQRVVEHVKEACGERERCCRRHAVRGECEGKTEADKDDADVLDRVIGEQPFEIVLHQGVEHAHDGGNAAQREHEHAPPPGGRPQQVEHDPHEAINRDLGHHPAHQGGDMAWRRRMGER